MFKNFVIYCDNIIKVYNCYILRNSHIVVKLQTINTKIVKDSSTGINLYEAGEVDSIDLAAEHVDKFKDSPEFKSTKNATTFFILINAGEE